jgi:proteasome lid subunit RPN8/RPN11
LSFYKTEICGLICGNSLFFLKNLSLRPADTFFIDPKKHVEIIEHKKIDFCFHSHPKTSCDPSSLDIELSNNALIPFLIFSGIEDKVCLYDPSTQETIYFSN